MGSLRRLEVARWNWSDLCSSDSYRGRWVALDQVRYDPVTSRPLEGEVVDVDDDLADLCGRMRESDRHACAILFVEDDARGAPVVALRSSMVPPRAAQH